MSNLMPKLPILFDTMDVYTISSPCTVCAQARNAIQNTLRYIFATLELYEYNYSDKL